MIVKILAILLLIGTVGATMSEFPKDGASAPAQQRPSPAEAFLAYVPEFGSESVGTAYERSFASPEWSACDHDGRNYVESRSAVRYKGEDRPVLMIFDVSDYARCDVVPRHEGDHKRRPRGSHRARSVQR